MERKIYEAPEAEVFVMEFNRMLQTSGQSTSPVTEVSANGIFSTSIAAGDGTADHGGSPRSKERGGDDFDWDLGF